MGEDVGISYKTPTLKDPAQSRYSNNRDKTSSWSGDGRSRVPIVYAGETRADQSSGSTDRHVGSNLRVSHPMLNAL